MVSSKAFSSLLPAALSSLNVEFSPPETVVNCSGCVWTLTSAMRRFGLACHSLNDIQHVRKILPDIISQMAFLAQENVTARRVTLKEYQNSLSQFLNDKGTLHRLIARAKIWLSDMKMRQIQANLSRMLADIQHYRDALENYFKENEHLIVGAVGEQRIIAGPDARPTAILFRVQLP